MDFGDSNAPPRPSFLPYFIAYTVVVCTIIVAGLEPWLEGPCNKPEPDITFSNPEYTRGCYLDRNPRLLMLTPREVKWARRISIASFFGAVVG